MNVNCIFKDLFNLFVFINKIYVLILDRKSNMNLCKIKVIFELIIIF